MPIVHFERIDISKVYPKLLGKVEIVLDNCHKAGSEYWAISGLRSFEEQAKIYAQGRDANGKVIDAKLVVSNAPPGSSLHNFGLAVDCAKDKEATKLGLQPDWLAPSYQVLADEAKKLDVEPGFYWKFKDPGHIQVPIGKLGVTLKTLNAWYKAGKLAKVWEELDKLPW
jgi:peptidoglycan L-alanyl-D-glutamate endopeptidase CwlK